MTSTWEHDPGLALGSIFSRLTCSPPSTSCRTLLPQLQPSVDGILRTLSPTDADVFHSVLNGIPLISHTPPVAKQPPPIPADTSPDAIADAILAASLSATLRPTIRTNLVLFFVNLSPPPGGVMFLPSADDLR